MRNEDKRQNFKKTVAAGNVLRVVFAPYARVLGTRLITEHATYRYRAIGSL